ncbi:MAG: hypothetical protein IJ840_02825 [Bacteroidales bacterium]|nr:hypothetical protein [Bacteroidales bacterium]
MRKLTLLALLLCAGLTLRAANDTANEDPAVTPEAFGCVGDGVTDDTEALQKAFDFCLANNRQLRSLKGKTYAVSRTIMAHTSNDIQIDFGGAVILAAKPMEHILDLDNYDIPDKIGHSSVINNLVLDCGSTSGGVYCPRAAKVSFNSLMVRNCALKAFRVEKGYEVFVTNSHIQCTTGPDSYGIYMDTGDCHFDNIVILNALMAIYQLTSINFYDKIHSWLSKNVEGSVFVHLVDGLAHLEQSYCDTAEKGYYIEGPSVLRLIGCYYYNNPRCYDSPVPPTIFHFAKPELATKATISLEGSSFNTGGLDVRISNVEDNHIQFSHCFVNPGIKGNVGSFTLSEAEGVSFRRAYGTIGDNTQYAFRAGEEANRLVIDADIASAAKGTVTVATLPEAYAPAEDQYGISTLIGSKGETMAVPVHVAPSGSVTFHCPPKVSPVRIVLEMEYVQ